MISMFAFTSMLFSLVAVTSYSYEVKLVFFGMAACSLCVAIAFFISSLIEEDTVTTKPVPVPKPRNKKVVHDTVIPIRDSKGRYIKSHPQTNFKK